MSRNHFQEKEKKGTYSRSGTIFTRRGEVATPFFMPVGTKGLVKNLSPTQIAGTGSQILLANTYHLHRHPGEKVIQKAGGLQKFNRWDKPMLTDSGGFQVFSLAKIRKITEEGVKFKDPKTGDEVFITPEKSMQIQVSLGSDIIMAFDDLTGLSLQDRERSLDAVERTHRWLVRCITEFKKLTNQLPDSKRPLLFGISQGGLNKDLRQKSLEFVQSQEVDGVAIGGLSVGESRQEMHEILDFLAPQYDPIRVRYLMGVGDPIDLRYALDNGIDMMDCVLPTRNARHGTIWLTGDRKINLKNAQFSDDFSVIDQNCDCDTCKLGYSRAFIRHLFKSEDPLGGNLASVHNLRYLQRICESYR